VLIPDSVNKGARHVAHRIAVLTVGGV